MLHKYYEKGGKLLEQQAKKRFLISFLYIAVIGTITIIVSRFLLFRMFPFLLSLIVAALSQKPSRFLSEKTGIKKPILSMLLAAGIYIGVVSFFGFFGISFDNFFGWSD